MFGKSPALVTGIPAQKACPTSGKTYPSELNGLGWTGNTTGRLRRCGTSAKSPRSRPTSVWSVDWSTTTNCKCRDLSLMCWGADAGDRGVNSGAVAVQFILAGDTPVVVVNCREGDSVVLLTERE